MFKVYQFISVCSVIFASGCTTKPSESQHPQLTNFTRFDVVAQNGKGLTVAFFGASLTWGANATDHARTSYRALVAQKLKAKYPEAHFTFPKAMPYLDALIRMYLPIWRSGLGVDVIDPADDLSDYKLIFLPYHHICTEAFAEKLKNYVSEGGTLVITSKTCHKDDSGKYYGHLYGPLKELTGAVARDTFNQTAGTEIQWKGQTFTDLRDTEHVELTGEGTVLATFDTGTPALIEKQHGKGRCFFAACVSESLNTALLQHVAEITGQTVVKTPMEQVGILPHLTREGTWIFNHRDEEINLFGSTIASGDYALLDQSLKSLQA